LRPPRPPPLVPFAPQALDYVIDSARRHGIALILSFIDNWKYYNGVAQFVDWCGPGRLMSRPMDAGGDTDDSKWSPDQKKYEVGRNALFFSEPRCHQVFQDHVRFILNRKVRPQGLLARRAAGRRRRAAVGSHMTAVCWLKVGVINLISAAPPPQPRASAPPRTPSMAACTRRTPPSCHGT
jgi:hypothetical protein